MVKLWQMNKWLVSSSSPWLLLWLWATTASAQLPFQGHIKLQAASARSADDSLESTLGKKVLNDYSLDLRLKNSYQWRAWQAEVHYQLERLQGDSAALHDKLKSTLPAFHAERNQTQWWSLSRTLEDSQQRYMVQRLARLSMGYANENLVLRLGRQALSWGQGQMFNPLDLFDPFAPDANDKDYKPGADMLYGQWLFADGSDLQSVIVPRRNPVTATVESQQSSMAIKWLTFWQPLQIDLMAARHYRDKVLGIGLSGAWHEAVWRMNLVPTWLDQGGSQTSVVINLSHAWQWVEKNVNGTLEYFHNGFGQSGADYTLSTLSPALTQRLARGEVFNTGQNYLAAQLSIEWTPLLTLTPLGIVNLNEGSSLWVGQANYSLSQNTNLKLGFNFGLGAKGTEFGGLRLTPTSDTYYHQPRQVYCRLEWFF